MRLLDHALFMHGERKLYIRCLNGGKAAWLDRDGATSQLQEK